MNWTSLSARQKNKLLQHLQSYIRDERLDRLTQVLSNRTRHLTIVLEDIYQERNAGAIIRTADCFGIQDVHIIENKYISKVTHTIAQGSEKWLTTHVHHPDDADVKTVTSNLRDKGYLICVATPEAETELSDIDTSPKLALVLGSEKEGVTAALKDEADIQFRIPIYGFSESYNVSVAAALMLQELRTKMVSSSVEWSLSEEEKLELMIDWCIKSMVSGEEITQWFLVNKLN
ncbi:MAG TPA: rRNA methyltransferase [Flavobacteriales bacterium]|jgi:tRNA (guanosine-2'-O-)-methyltransferase|nr:rRNA methyltransferase [Flavobacteriales bacterium]